MIDPEKLAEELISVQPMSNDAIKPLYEASKKEGQLKAEGYKPVSGLGLMWIKEEQESD